MPTARMHSPSDRATHCGLYELTFGVKPETPYPLAMAANGVEAEFVQPCRRGALARVAPLPTLV
jgi:hypothetical protein